MPTDPSILFQQKTIADYMAENEDRNLQRRLAESKLSGGNEFDLDKAAKNAAYKASLGQMLAPEEIAAIQAYSGFHPGAQSFDPVTGAAITKPSLAEALGLKGNQGGYMTPDFVPQKGGFESIPSMTISEFDTPVPKMGDIPLPPRGGIMTDGMADIPLANTPKGQMMQFQDALDLRRKEAENKMKIESQKFEPMNEGQGKAATFADRMKEADALISKKNIEAAQTDPLMRGLGGVPVLGNYAITPEYQKAEQAERNFINAVLRRESGAVISPQEFANAKKQYFPQPGDRPETIQQKAMNRKTAIEGIAREAGPAYTPKAAAPNNIREQLKALGMTDQEIDERIRQ